jgi:hypothetical protein
MSKGRSCAFCGKETTLTKEHVFPDCFQKTFEPITPTTTPAGEKAILSALEVRDVCAPCNNGPLSQLDTYFCNLNGLYFSKIVRPGDCIQFRYEFDLLLRVLLKIGYNVARAKKWPLGQWQEVAEYVLGNTPCIVGFHLFLQLMIPTPVEKANRPVSPGTKEVPPWPMSVYPIDVSNFHGLLSGFWISVWSFRFFVLREDGHTPQPIRQRTLTKCRKHTTGAYELTRKGTATAYASSVEVLDAIKGSQIFDEQLAQARKLKAATESKRKKPRGTEPIGF